jgi:hypothetical protein
MTEPPRRSFLDLGPRVGLAVLVVFFGLELWGIWWGQRAPDRVLGFQMFNESSRLTIQLFREVPGKGRHKRKRQLLPVKDGHWQAPDAEGTLRDYHWQDRVKYWPLWALGRSVPAKYGRAAQLFRLQAALDDAVRHIPHDTQTLALVAEVETTRNGAPPETVRLRAEKKP